MNIEYHKWWSPNLAQEMELKIYGHAGKPALVFPSITGRFTEFEDCGMVEACRPFLDEGRIQMFAVDNIYCQTWLNDGASLADRAKRHSQYERYVLEEVIPCIRWRRGEGGIMATGCSFGGFNSANVFFHRPDIFDTVISLSGFYQLKHFVGAVDDNAYPYEPLAYLPDITDPWYLERYRRGRFVACVGQGEWEDRFLADTLELRRILGEKQIPAWVDVWGQDVAHDWPWWTRQMPYFLQRLGF
ncbi:MAG: esterase family protein [Deltaproteobacteria bacterium]|nr:esterase family protein [Deltaproteobacteria bacterium]